MPLWMLSVIRLLRPTPGANFSTRSNAPGQHGPPPPSPPRSERDYIIATYQLQEKIMTGISDLQAADASLATVVAAAITEIGTLAAGIAANSEDAAVETQAQAISALVAQLQTAVTSAQTPAAPATPPASS
jgi:hypothetical protein